MGDSIEQIVVVKQPQKAMLYKALMIVACCVSAIFVVYAIGVLSTAILVVLTFMLFRYYDAEYEYTYVEKNLDVDRIMARSSRKRLGSYDFSKMEIMAYAGHDKLGTYDRMNCKTYNYASGFNPDKEYIVYLNNNSEMVKLVFEPNEKMVEAIRKIDSRKVFVREENQ